MTTNLLIFIIIYLVCAWIVRAFAKATHTSFGVIEWGIAALPVVNILGSIVVLLFVFGNASRYPEDLKRDFFKQLTSFIGHGKDRKL